MALCTVRAFKAGGYDHFSNWFWRHPPLFSIIMLLLKPFDAGFAERTELFVIFAAFVSAIFLFLLNKKVYGNETALWSVFFLAVMPGTVFYDTWIKSDCFVSLFGLISILCFTNKKFFYSGLFLGLAFLSKETAIFFAFAIGFLWFVKVRNKKTLLYLTVIPLIISGWWYALPLFSSDRGIRNLGILEHINFAFKNNSGYIEPWYYYLLSITGAIGLTGTVILGVSIIFLAYRFVFLFFRRGMNNYTEIFCSQREKMWSFFLLIPSLLLLTLLPSKVAWVIISLFPAIVTICAMIMNKTFGLFRNIVLSKTPSEMKDRLFYLALSIVAVILFINVVFCPYEKRMEALVPDQYRGAGYSREIAETLNKMVKENERIFLTSFHYWKGLSAGHACPVFAYYFTNNAEVIIRPHTYPLDKILEDIKEYKLDWAMLSPEPGEDEKNILDGFVRNLHIEPAIVLRKAFIFRTSSLYK